MASSNKALFFSKIPTGYAEPGEHLTIENVPAPVTPEDGVTIKMLYSSFDPFQRGRMRAPEKKSYFAPMIVGKPVDNYAVGVVDSSNHPDYKVGALVKGFLPTQAYVPIPGDVLKKAPLQVLTDTEGLDPSVFLGAIGMPGLTAYSALFEIGKPQEGETVFVSAASGAVGALVGQIAMLKGLKVVGSVGSEEKLKYITEELGFTGFNYKTEKPLDALRRLAPQGIDIYWDNVGGEHLEAALWSMNNSGRIVACGQISQYNLPDDKMYPLRNSYLMTTKRLLMQGFIVNDPNFGPKYGAQHAKDMGQWIRAGTLKARVDVTHGIENAAEGLCGIFKGRNFGKAVLKY